MSETLLSPGISQNEQDVSSVKPRVASVGAAIIGPTAKGPLTPTAISSMAEYESIYGTTVTSGSVVYSYLTTISARNYLNNTKKSILVQRVVSGSFTPASSTAYSLLNAASASFSLSTISVGTITNNSGSENASGSLASGSQDNIRWEIANVNTGSGTFSLYIRQGDDTTKNKSILETYNGLSLDPLSSDYIEKKIGNTIQNIRSEGSEYYVQTSGSYPNSSNYVIVSSVTAKTKFNEYISATNVQGISPNSYTQSIALLNNKDDYKFNVITIPGLNAADHGSVVQSLVSLAENRQDCIAIVDVDGYGSSITEVISAARSIDSSYAATYWPWVNVLENNKLTWIPASTLIPGVFAAMDRTSQPWFAPAGTSKGGLGTVVQAERKLTSGNKDTLYSNNVNPIATMATSTGSNIVIMGQKTLQKRATALDRINVRRLLIELKEFIGNVANDLLFEQNTAVTRNSFLSQVNPYLESVQQRQGVYAFNVVMDDSNNTPTTIDQNALIGQITIQPTKTVEFILLNFTVSPTGVSF